MAISFSFFRAGHLLVGDLCTIRLTVSTPIEREFEERLWGLVPEVRIEFESLARQKVREYLGPRFEVVDVFPTKGSVEFLVLIGVAGTVYMTISRYKSFRESLQLLVADLKSLLERMFRRFQRQGLYVSGSWYPGPALAPFEEALAIPPSAGANQILLWYLIVSHATLLLTFVWLVVRGTP